MMDDVFKDEVARGDIIIHMDDILIADAPEPRACAYISGGLAGPTLEREQGHPHLKAWAMDLTPPK